jgi:hypothetical protein
LHQNTVTILDDSLAGKVAVENQGSRRTPTNTLEVFAVIRNRTDFTLQAEGRMSLYDINGAPLDGPSAWQRLYLPPNSIVHYKEISTVTQDIGFYNIEIREGR